jgi:hypothetical protein
MKYISMKMEPKGSTPHAGTNTNTEVYLLSHEYRAPSFESLPSVLFRTALLLSVVDSNKTYQGRSCGGRGTAATWHGSFLGTAVTITVCGGGGGAVKGRTQATTHARTRGPSYAVVSARACVCVGARRPTTRWECTSWPAGRGKTLTARSCGSTSSKY